MNKLDDSDFINEISKYDSLMFTECWISKFSNVNINGYECFVCPRQKCNNKAKCSSGGITVYFKHHLSQKISLIKRNTKGNLWFMLDKSVFDNVTDRYLCVCYIPPESSNVYRNRSSELFQFDFFNQLSIDIDYFQQVGEVFITGDLNSRTGSLVVQMLKAKKVHNCSN